MGSESENLEERLKSLIAQLKTEGGILDRIVYKGKNQHRHCLYFQYLLKVRRDVKLLLSAGLEEILGYHFQIIDGNKPKQKVYLLQRLKGEKHHNGKHHNGKHNFHKRLLGVARLLSQMVEPILKAAIQISTLLARSFFMGFSLTVLALLARFRVLIQQILLDIVSVFNMVSSISQKELSVKLKEEKIEVFQEYYPPSGEVLTLECMWEGDKFVLLEKTSETEGKNKAEDLKGGREISLRTSLIQYHCVEAPNEDLCLDDELRYEMVTATHTNEQCVDSVNEIKRDTVDASSYQSVKINEDIEVKDFDDGNDGNYETSPKALCTAEDSKVASTSSFQSPKAKSIAGGSKVASTSSFQSPRAKSIAGGSKVVASRSPFPSPKTQSQSKQKRVAFVSVRKSAPSEVDDGRFCKRLKTTWPSGRGNDSDDPFFDLLTAGSMKDSLF